MALVKSGTFGSSPSAAYELHAAQTAGSGNSRTVKITLRLKVNGSNSQSKYGYGLSWIARVKDSYSATTSIKGNEYWYGGEGYREFSQTLTVDVGTTNSTSITVGFQLKRSDGGSTSWNQTITGTFSVDKTNTKPYFPSNQQYVNIKQGSSSSGTLLSGIIPENISTVYIEWGQASDAEGGTLTYGLNHRINGGNWSQIDFGTDRAHSYSIGTGNQGQTLEYYVDVKDNGGLWSDKIYSSKITKNTFTGSTLNDIASISYNTTSLKLSWTSPSNTTSHADKSKFNFTISCDGLTLYNATASNAATSLTFKIVTSALTDGSPYILKNDLKNKFANTSYKGNLTFTLTSSNAYGSSKTSSKICAVNLQSNPNAVNSVTISTDAAKSTCYQKPISSVNSYYFIPDGNKVIRVEWSSVTGNIGESITYDIYVAYGSEKWTLLQSNLTATYYNHVVPKQTSSRTIKYRVTTKTNYGTSSSKDTATQTLHYYNAPTITTGAITRSSTSATVSVTITSRTSLSGVTTVGTWTCYNKGTTTSVSTGNLGTSQAAQNISVTKLTESGQYDLKITYKDNTVFSTNTTAPIISIGQTASAFFINKYGIGVNGNVATAERNLNIKGSIGLTAPNNSYTRTAIKTYNGDGNGMGMAIGSGGMLAIGSGESAISILEETGSSGIMNGKTMAEERTYITSDNNIYFASNCNTIANKKIGVFNTAGDIHVPGAMYVGSNSGTGGSTNSRVYAQNFKPSKSDVGLGNVNNWGASSDKGANSTSQYATTNMVAQVRAEAVKFDHTGDTSGNHHPRIYVSGKDWLRAPSGGFVPYSHQKGYLGLADKAWYDLHTVHLNSKLIGGKAGSWWNCMPVIGGDGVIEIGRYIDWHYASGETKDYHSRTSVMDWDCVDFSGAIRLNGCIYPGRSLQAGWDVGQSGARFYTVYCNNVNQSSDKNLKENITYVDDKTSSFSRIKSKTPFKDFLVEDLKIATYRYKRENKLSEEELKRNPEGTDLEYREEDNQIGFIAQDVINTDIGSTFVYGEEGSMNYSPSGFTAVVAKALQETIKELDDLKEENKELKNRIIEIEKRLEEK